MSLRLLLVGDGRMGQAVAACAARRGHDVVACLGARGNAEGAGIARHAPRADVAIEFTRPSAAAANVRACLALGLPVVCGTTGWDAELEALRTEARRVGGGLLWAPNFSLGVALAMRLAREVGRLYAHRPEFDVHLVESHHRAKRDAPSGTAHALVAALREGGRDDVPVTSVRVGHDPGTHAILVDGPFERVTLRHECRDRLAFADGAVRAAEWLHGRRGTFTLEDVLASEGGA